jgi:hypothetical protein
MRGVVADVDAPTEAIGQTALARERALALGADHARIALRLAVTAVVPIAREVDAAVVAVVEALRAGERAPPADTRGAARAGHRAVTAVVRVRRDVDALVAALVEVVRTVGGAGAFDAEGPVSHDASQAPQFEGSFSGSMHVPPQQSCSSAQGSSEQFDTWFPLEHAPDDRTTEQSQTLEFLSSDRIPGMWHLTPDPRFVPPSHGEPTSSGGR